MNLNITEIILYINENLPKTFLKKNTIQSPAKYLFFFYLLQISVKDTQTTRELVADVQYGVKLHLLPVGKKTRSNFLMSKQKNLLISVRHFLIFFFYVKEEKYSRNNLMSE